MLTRIRQAAVAAGAFVAAMVLHANLALANFENEQFLNRSTNLVNAIYETATTIIYTVGGIGVMVLAVMAFFGKFKWTHLLALAGGLFLVGATDLLIQFLTGEDNAGAGDP